ncbi:microtubule-associated proteins 1A/1B light chain 3C-like [Poeciliopsis prolifica]|uniref:microtubule-associated proteins 1A/1B light chain 3C-like n=1 Tax=Poeciliopsis prolifica TaxID=188132 RepID=UPI002413DE45|nr:microtubule-associated proteins 1A/1B light chain 3C-like [Poeciliopsis prolifica]
MSPHDRTAQQNKPFKQRKSFETRKMEVAGIRSKFPNKIPVIIERYDKEKNLPPLDKTKFLVPHELTMTQFVTIIRNRMALLHNQTFNLFINRKSLATLSLTMAQVYKDHQDDDGFLYMTYASRRCSAFDWTAALLGWPAVNRKYFNRCSL